MFLSPGMLLSPRHASSDYLFIVQRYDDNGKAYSDLRIWEEQSAWKGEDQQRSNRKEANNLGSTEMLPKWL